MGEKCQTTSPLKVHIRFTPRKYDTPRKGLYQSCSKHCEIFKLGFLSFFSFSLAWDYMG